MALLGLDAATRTGFALMSHAGVKAGSWKPRSVALSGEIFATFEEWLEDLIEREEVRVIALEAPQPSMRKQTTRGRVRAGRGFQDVVKESATTNFASLRRLYGIAACVEAVAHRAGVPIYEVASSKWRVHYLGVARSPQPGGDQFPVLRCKSTGVSRKFLNPDGLKSTAWLKAAAVEMAHAHHVAVDGNDAADAVGIVHWLHAERRTERAAKALPPLKSAVARAAAEAVFK